MKLAIIGIRYIDPVKKIVWNDYEMVKATMCKYFLDWNGIDEIVSGGALGADSLGAKFAAEVGIKTKIFLPDWYPDGVFDKGAGFKRNHEIIDYADIILAFWNKGGISKGTGHSIGLAKKLGKPTLIIYI